jgi:hypothetical protein
VHNPRHAQLFKEPFRKAVTRGFELDCFEAYDLVADPHEQANLLAGLDPAGLASGAALPPELAAMRTALERWLAEPQHEREMSWPGLSQAGLDHMRQLGYVGGGEDRPDINFLSDCTTR